MSLLEIRHLQLKFYDTQPPLEVVKDISFAMKEGEILGIVGESGSGKTQTALSVLGLLKKHEEISAGEILFEGEKSGRVFSKGTGSCPGKRYQHDFPGAHDVFKSCTACGAAGGRGPQAAYFLYKRGM